jgi:hypothetical protein
VLPDNDSGKIGVAFSSVSEIAKGADARRLTLSLPLINRHLLTIGFTIYTPKDGVDDRLARSPQKSVAETLNESLANDDPINEKWTISAGELSEELLMARIASLRADRVLAINSLCVVRGKRGRTQMHIPMMDFKLPAEDHSNIGLIRAFLESIGRYGVLLHSGNSFHYIGFDLMKPRDWHVFLGHCLLAKYQAPTHASSRYEPYVDERWIGHTLKLGTGILRITHNESKPTIPNVCEVFFRRDHSIPK